MDENTSAPLERRCPACGASMLYDARFCGACGTESLPASAALDAPAGSPTEAPREAPASPPPPVPAAEPPSVAPAAALPAALAAAPVPSAFAGGRICPWCDAPNPPEGARCVACGAVFPTPEGDEALERAARARIQSMEEDIKPIKAGWWPFRSRGPASNSSGSNGV